MAYRYAFAPACARDLDALTRRQHGLLLRLVVEHIPAILENPQGAGEKKSGPLKDCYGFVLTISGAALRLVYTLHNDVVIFLAVGPHDTAYRDATRRV
jgi:mRNA-degrading endonuclease RelE of RelBE toxin-antitoxin system